jgi:hypothetical protein
MSEGASRAVAGPGKLESDHAQRNFHLDRVRPLTRARIGVRVRAEQSAAGGGVGRPHTEDRRGRRIERGPQAAQKHPDEAESARNRRTCAPFA